MKMVEYDKAVIRNTEQASSLLQHLSTWEGPIGFDLEWAEDGHHLVSAQFAYLNDKGRYEAYYIAIGHRAIRGIEFDPSTGEITRTKGLVPEQVDCKTFVHDLHKHIAMNDKLTLVGHNLSADITTSYTQFKKHGLFLDWLPTIIDTYGLAAITCIDQNNRGLKAVALNLLGYQMKLLKEVCPHASRIDEGSIHDVSEYGLDDAVVPLLIKDIMINNLEQSEMGRTTLDFFKRVECECVKVFAHMQAHGVKINTNTLLEVHEECSKRVKELDEELRELLDLPPHPDYWDNFNKYVRSKQTEMRAKIKALSATPLKGKALKALTDACRQEFAEWKEAEIHAAEEEIGWKHNEGFNFGSTQQVSRRFFEGEQSWVEPTEVGDTKIYPKIGVLWYPNILNAGILEDTKSNYGLIKRGSNGLFGTGAPILKNIVYYKAGTAKGIKAAELMIETSKLKKILQQYTHALIDKCDVDDRIHTFFNQFHTETGRASSKNPNLQNISAHGDIAHKIRSAFCASPGWLIVGADYSQMELRILAHIGLKLSGLDNLAQVFWDGGDPHSATAERLGITRKRAKAINFSVAYGKTAMGLAQELRIPIYEAEKMLSDYFKSHPDVKYYIKYQHLFVEENGYVTTLFGRVRDLSQSKGNKKKNQSINTPIQGSGADIMKIAMVKFYHELRDQKLLNTSVRILLQVHDELMVECKPEIAEMIESLLCLCMRTAARLEVDLAVDSSIGKNWLDVH